MYSFVPLNIWWCWRKLFSCRFVFNVSQDSSKEPLQWKLPLYRLRPHSKSQTHQKLLKWWAVRGLRWIFPYQMPCHSSCECWRGAWWGGVVKIPSSTTAMRSERRLGHAAMRSWYPKGVGQWNGARKRPVKIAPRFDVVYNAPKRKSRKSKKR